MLQSITVVSIIIISIISAIIARDKEAFALPYS